MSIPATPDHELLSLQYRAEGLGGSVGFGVLPCLVIVDMANGFLDPTYRIGVDLPDVVEANRQLLNIFRANDLLRVFITTSYAKDLRDAGYIPSKLPGVAELIDGSEAVQIDRRLDRGGDELIITKKAASAFQFTHLASWLSSHQVDTVIVGGVTTSGCVRATVVDALSCGFRPIVPRQAVGDRAESAHEASLFDIEAKYGDVVELDAVIDWAESIDDRVRHRSSSQR